MSADRLPDPERGWTNVPAKPVEQSSAQTRKVVTGNGPPVSAAVSSAKPPEADYEVALRQIAHVLGGANDPEPREWKCGNNCEGCRHEMAEASALALNALGFSTYKEMLDGR